jgi:exodeoxyribonuclease VII large subunit
MPTSSEPRAMSVSELTLAIKGTLEKRFSGAWVSGEVSDVARPHSGHIYFTLKDESAQIKAIVWRSVAERLKFDLDDGLEIVCRGDIDVYPARGAYQFIVRQAEPLGLGALQLAYRKLYEKLAAEGLFDPRRKRPLPRFPRRIAIVTSPSGAAIRDFLEVLRRRWQGVEVLIIPARVQGEGAAAEIARGIAAANRLSPAPDLLVVARGGGSLEDMWCFNEEPVVRAIHASRIPVVSAVGHEIDVTLADLVADVRAATPTEAAERIVPSADDIHATLRQHQARLAASLRSCAAHARSRYTSLAERRVFRRPFDALRDRALRLDELDQRAEQAVRRLLARRGEQAIALAAQLEGLSPLGVLARGYSVTLRDGEVIRDAAQLAPGETIVTRLAQGEVVSRVEEVKSREP